MKYKDKSKDKSNNKTDRERNRERDQNALQCPHPPNAHIVLKPGLTYHAACCHFMFEKPWELS